MTPSRREFLKLVSLALAGTMLPSCSSGGSDVGREAFGFHLNPVLLNSTGSSALGKSLKALAPTDPDAPFFSYSTGLGVRHVQLPLADGLTKAYPTEDDYQRMKRIGDFVISNIWKGYWEDAQDAREMRNVIERCAGNGLYLTIRLEDQTRNSNYAYAAATDETWFVNEFEPYIRSVAQYAKGRAYAYQVWNEAWHPDRYMLGPTGAKITADEYVTFLARVRSILKAEDPDALVLNSGMTSIVESYYNSITKDLLDAGLEDYTDQFNFHYYSDGGVDASTEAKLIEMDMLIDRDVILTECNHIDPTREAEGKLNAIRAIREAIARWFHMKGLFVFCWNAGTADEELLPWAVKGTELEELLYQEFNG